MFGAKQWEFQVGPAIGISAGDQLWVARYILEVYMLDTFFSWHVCMYVCVSVPLSVLLSF